MAAFQKVELLMMGALRQHSCVTELSLSVNRLLLVGPQSGCLPVLVTDFSFDQQRLCSQDGNPISQNDRRNRSCIIQTEYPYLGNQRPLLVSHFSLGSKLLNKKVELFITSQWKCPLIPNRNNSSGQFPSDDGVPDKRIAQVVKVYAVLVLSPSLDQFNQLATRCHIIVNRLVTYWSLEVSLKERKE